MSVQSAARLGLGLSKLSRRNFIRTGTATLAAAAAYEPTVHFLAGRLRLANQSGRVSLQIDGEDAFVIDKRAFSGQPHVGLDQGRSRYSVWLENARIAGSPRLADLHLELWEGLLDWQYRLAFPELGLIFRGNLAAWLLEGKGAWSKLRNFQFEGRAFGIDARRCESIVFFPDWTLNFRG
jgi:hypothetical protein